MPPAPLSKHRASFGGKEFHKYIAGEVQDEFGPRFVPHVFPGRNGARQEEMGNLPSRSTFKLEFPGNHDEFLAAWLTKPRDVLVHPLYGKRNVVIKGPIRGTLHPVARGRIYAVEISFEEDTLDQQRDELKQGPASLGQSTLSSASQTNTFAEAMRAAVYAQYTVGAYAVQIRQQALNVKALFNGFAGAAMTYANAALAQFNVGTWDPSLDQQLKLLPQLVERATRAGRTLSESLSYDSTTAAEVTLQAATDLSAAIQRQFPPPVQWEVREKMSLNRLVGALYYKQPAAQRLELAEQIAQINRILRPDVLQPGRRLTVPFAGAL